MKRTIIPKSATDRVLVAVALILITASVTPPYVDYRLVIFGTAVGILGLAISYLFQDQVRKTDAADDYSATIAQITGIVGQLADLNRFLERERARVAETEATVKRLDDEKARLEPVVLTQRETVEAILSAHSERTAKSVWKERVLGFVFGGLRWIQPFPCGPRATPPAVADLGLVRRICHAPRTTDTISVCSLISSTT